MLTPGAVMQHDGNTTARGPKPRQVTVVAMSTSLMPLVEAADQIDYAATAFMILCASLVLLMTTPGLALFYGGMTRTKSVLNMMMMSFGATRSSTRSATRATATSPSSSSSGSS